MDKISPYRFTTFIAVLAIAEVWLNEELSVLYHHNGPFPSVTISRSAQNYPEFLFFRVGMIALPTMMLIAWFMHQAWLSDKSSVYRNFHYISTVLGSVAAVFLMFSTATIDTGKMNGNLHTYCAGKFFLLTMIACLLDCVLATFTKGPNLTLKWLNSGLVLATLWYSSASKDKHAGVIAEYVATHLVIMYFWIMGRDMENYQVIIA